MTAEDFFLSAIALFVFFFVVTPVLHRLCNKRGKRDEMAQLHGQEVVPSETMRRVS